MVETRAVLFDLDGTLIDTTNLILRCFDHSWQSVCGRGHAREALIETFGTPLRAAMVSLASSSEDLSPRLDEMSEADLIDRLLNEYRSFNVANHDALARPFEGVEEVVRRLRERGYLIGVVTSKGRELASRGLSLCSLDGLIDAAVFLEDTEKHKPEPEPILAALEKLNAARSGAAYVGDSHNDIIAGRAAGVRTVAALWGPAPRAALEAARPDYMAGSMYSLLDIFE
ncbi:MAG TPA: HAD-IA family hydrolase [Blastocatellia bacterium]|jgi:pyrophosphatase PpaX|nr:HAD-IA family hydrolase [Blastocatellia bacterium]